MRLSKEKTWKLCLEMWKWIDKHIEMLEDLVDHDASYKYVDFLKDMWARDHGYEGKLENGCFFCEYAETHGGRVDPEYCLNCPGHQVEAGFCCQPDEDDEEDTTNFDWGLQPREFYNYLKQLDRKRRRAKR